MWQQSEKVVSRNSPRKRRAPTSQSDNLGFLTTSEIFVFERISRRAKVPLHGLAAVFRKSTTSHIEWTTETPTSATKFNGIAPLFSPAVNSRLNRFSSGSQKIPACRGWHGNRKTPRGGCSRRFVQTSGSAGFAAENQLKFALTKRRLAA